MLDQRNARKFPATIWGLVAVATLAAGGTIGAPLVSFENGVEFHFANILLAVPFAILIFVVIAAIRRFTPLLALPRHHESSQGGSHFGAGAVKREHVSERSNRAGS